MPLWGKKKDKDKDKSPKKNKKGKGGYEPPNAAGALDLNVLMQLKEDDRISVMRMVAEGELSVEEAVKQVKEQAAEKIVVKAGGKKKRQGAVKKAFRGRVRLTATVESPESANPTLSVAVDCARDLEPLAPCAYVTAYLEDSASAAKTETNTTRVKIESKHPIFDEQFMWPISKRQFNMETWRLHIQLYDTQGGKVNKKNRKLGAMSFALAEIYDADSITEGWFKLLDERKGQLQNIAFIPKIKARVLQGQIPAGSGNKGIGGSGQHTDNRQPSIASPGRRAPQPLPTETRQPSVNSRPPMPVPEANGRGQSPPPSQPPRQSQPPPSQPPRQSQPRPAQPPPEQSQPAPQSRQPSMPSNTQPTPTPRQPTIKKAAPVPAPPPKVALSDFTFTKVLGRGSFGKVLLATMKGSSELVAIKVLKKTAVIEDDDVAGTMTEKRVLALSEGSPFLTKLHATFQDDASLCFVMEFVNGGDLMYHIQEQGTFDVGQSRFYMMEILLGLWYLHSKGVIYRDLKLDNVMLDSTGHIKIADFGMCKEKIFGSGTTTTFCGTPGYLAPEIIKEKPYGASVDFWSLGVLGYEFLMGDSPFEADDDDELFKMICNHPLDYTTDDGPPLDSSATSFLDGLLTRDPKQRLGCGPNGKEDIMAHGFFAGQSWDKMAARQITPPFKPTIDGTSNFDPEFTDQAAEITPIDQSYLDVIEQSEFKGFSFVNAGGIFHDRVDVNAVDDDDDGEVDLHKFKWYRPELTRPGVVKLLRGKPAGAFCVRESASQPGCYALSVSVSEKADKLWTGLITPTYDGKGNARYRLFVKQKFDSIPMLIEHYHHSPCVTIDRGSREVVLEDHI